MPPRRLVVPLLIALLFAFQPGMRPSAASGVVLTIVFEPLTSADPKLVLGNAATKPLQPLLKALNAQPIYRACPDDGKDSSCRPNTATVLVNGKIISSRNAQNEIEKLTIQLRSYNMLDAQTGSLDLSALVNPRVKTFADDTALSNALLEATKTITVADLLPLTGQPVLQPNGTIRLVIAPSVYQQFIQIIPASSDDATYQSTLVELLSRRHVQALVSSSFLGVATTGTATNASICGLGQRYLIFRMSMKTEERRLIGHTRLQVNAAGQFFDCVDPFGSPYTVGAVDALSIPTTGLALPKMFNLLSILFISRTNSWTYVGNAGSAISNLVDVDPSSSKVVANAAEQILQQLVDNLCAAIDSHQQASRLALGQSGSPPAPGPRGVPDNKAVRPAADTGGGGTPATGAAATTGTASLLPADFGNFTGPAPYPLKCEGGHLRVPIGPDDASTPLFDRGRVRPTPIPANPPLSTPTPTPTP